MDQAALQEPHLVGKGLSDQESPLGEIYPLLAQVASAIRTSAAAARSGNGAIFVMLSPGFFKSEPEKSRAIASGPTIRTELDELVIVDFNWTEGFPTLDFLVSLVISELEPFIIGAGKVCARRTSEGLVLFPTDDGRRIAGLHDLRSLAGVAAPG